MNKSNQYQKRGTQAKYAVFIFNFKPRVVLFSDIMTLFLPYLKTLSSVF